MFFVLFVFLTNVDLDFRSCLMRSSKYWAILGNVHAVRSCVSTPTSDDLSVVFFFFFSVVLWGGGNFPSVTSLYYYFA